MNLGLLQACVRAWRTSELRDLTVLVAKPTYGALVVTQYTRGRLLVAEGFEYCTQPCPLLCVHEAYMLRPLTM